MEVIEIRGNWYKKICSRTSLMYTRADIEVDGAMRGGVRTEHGVRCRSEVPEVRRLVGTSTAGTRHDTLGVSSVPGDAATSTRLLPQVYFSLRRCSSDAQVTLLTDMTVAGHLLVGVLTAL